jgi:hypothetical protein
MVFFRPVTIDPDMLQCLPCCRSICSTAKELSAWVYEKISNLWNAVASCWAGPLGGRGTETAKNLSLISGSVGLPTGRMKFEEMIRVIDRVIDAIPELMQTIEKKGDSPFCPVILLYALFEEEGAVEPESLFMRVSLETSNSGILPCCEGLRKKMHEYLAENKKVSKCEIHCMVGQRMQDRQGQARFNYADTHGGAGREGQTICIDVHEFGVQSQLSLKWNCSLGIVSKATEFFSGEYVSDEIVDLRVAADGSLETRPHVK